jgi:hypothetical protein
MIRPLIPVILSRLIGTHNSGPDTLLIGSLSSCASVSGLAIGPTVGGLLGMSWCICNDCSVFARFEGEECGRGDVNGLNPCLLFNGVDCGVMGSCSPPLTGWSGKPSASIFSNWRSCARRLIADVVVMSRSCRPALLADTRADWLAEDLGVKNLRNRFGVIGGGLLGLGPPDDRTFGDFERSFLVAGDGEVITAESSRIFSILLATVR